MIQPNITDHEPININYEVDVEHESILKEDEKLIEILFEIVINDYAIQI